MHRLHFSTYAKLKIAHTFRTWIKPKFLNYIVPMFCSYGDDDDADDDDNDDGMRHR